MGSGLPRGETMGADQETQTSEAVESFISKVAVVQRPSHVIVHPLVLLSVVDHYRRAAMNTKKRVIGVLLGNWVGQSVNITSSYAVPFEEDESNPNVWFLDHNYHETMSDLSKKVSAKERPVGWYHTGPNIRSSDLEINEVFRRYCLRTCPVLVIVDPLAAEDRVGLPFDAFASIDQLSSEASGAGSSSSSSSANTTSTASKAFVHLPSVMEAEEAEEIGVEHLLRDVKGTVQGDLTTKVIAKVDSLRALHSQLASLIEYVEAVRAGRLPRNNAIIYQLQDLFNLLPDVHSVEAQEAMAVAANDQALMMFTGNLLRTLVALHELINNKLEDSTQLQAQAQTN